jgi:Putative beta barrel porin-7 (BBP7)
MRRLFGPRTFCALWALLVAAPAAAQTYNYPSSSPAAAPRSSSYDFGFATPATRQVSHDEAEAPQMLEPDYVGTSYHAQQGQSPTLALEPRPAPVDEGSPYQDAMKDGWDTCTSCLPAPRWFGSAGAVVLSRADRDFIITCPCTSPTLRYNDADMPMMLGPQISLGRYLGCNGCFGIQATYWGLYPGDQSASIVPDSDSLRSRFNWGGLEVCGDSVSDRFDDASRYTLTRDFQVHSFELNLLNFSHAYGNGCGSQCGPGNSCAPNFRYNFLLGFRYMDFREGFLFTGEHTSAPDVVEELSYNVDVQNQLAGFQIGGRTDYYLTCNLSAFASAKGGVYGNRMSLQQAIRDCDGNPAVIVEGEYVQPPDNKFDINSSRTNVAFLTEFALGGNYKISDCWSVYAGYQVVIATGVAEANDQVPSQFQFLDEARSIKNDGSLILHGAFFGASYNF